MANIILLGAPGSGKGSQAAAIIKEFRIPQISTGDMLREARKMGTEMGMLAAHYMDSGELVPDEVVIGIVKERLAMDDCKNGFILDGFPRTIPQAQTLDGVLRELGIELNHVIEIDVPDELIIPRITGRRSCPSCKRPYHVAFLKPRSENVCDDCSETLVQRSDDTEEAVNVRLEAYKMKTAPLAEYYKKSGKLRVVDGVGDMKEISARIFAILA
ncbi:adenylate kinase [Myxococcota bacterium]|nr:adenylate kinase [Myxococcota bacterium]